jgi:hypothetical protein
VPKKMVSFHLTGFKELAAAMDPAAFEAAIKPHIGRATALNAKVAEAKVRQVIRSNVSPRNAALTQAVKSASKSLIDSSALFASVTSKQTNEYNAFVGTLRTDKAFKVAKMVHDGATVDVTPKMRGLFFRLWRASNDAKAADSLRGRAAALFERYQGWLPLAPTTTQIQIPARPYIELAFDADLVKTCAQNWNNGLQQAFKTIAMQINKGGA